MSPPVKSLTRRLGMVEALTRSVAKPNFGDECEGITCGLCLEKSRKRNGKKNHMEVLSWGPL